jgi:hypothetical protein
MQYASCSSKLRWTGSENLSGNAFSLQRGCQMHLKKAEVEHTLHNSNPCTPHHLLVADTVAMSTRTTR